MITVKGTKYELDCHGITTRQAEFIILLAEGYTQRQLAAKVGVTYQAITVRIAGAKEKLSARTLTEMVATRFAEGWMRKKGESKDA